MALPGLLQKALKEESFKAFLFTDEGLARG